jgi:hypothetical protein
MNKIFIVSLSFIVFSALTIKLAFANTDVPKTVCKVSASVSSIAAGTVVGTPIAIVRKTGSEYIGCVKEFKKDSNTYKFWGAAYSAPVAVVSGLIKGTVYGAKNAVHYSFNKPFGKEAFSLGNLEDSVRAPAKTNMQPNTDKPETQPWGTPR